MCPSAAWSQENSVAPGLQCRCAKKGQRGGGALAGSFTELPGRVRWGEGLQEEEAHMGAGVRMETGYVSAESPAWWCDRVRMESRQRSGALGTQQRRGEAPALFAQLSLGPGLTHERLWGCGQDSWGRGGCVE